MVIQPSDLDIARQGFVKHLRFVTSSAMIFLDPWLGIYAPENDEVYMPHVDGFRALAVIIVCLFHLDVPGFSGGYLGVDMFFVISGHLVTRQIVSQICREGSFNPFPFYRRRILRLAPAHLVMMSACIMPACALLTSVTLKKFGLSLIASSLSVSNLYFWSESGYFGSLRRYLPLLHTWSLGVEEQFYLIWPLIIAVCSKLASPARGLLVTYFTSLGLVALEVTGNLSSKVSDSLFYLMPFRIHQFALGGLFVGLTRAVVTPESRSFLGVFGLMIIAVCCFCFQTSAPFLLTSFVSSIASLMVLGFGDSNVTSFVLTSPLARYVGRRSYSIYLFHWPVIVFFKYWKFSTPCDLEKICYFVLAFFFGALSYKFIEQPFRYGWLSKSKMTFVAIGIMVAVLANFGYLIFCGKLTLKTPLLPVELLEDVERARNSARARACVGIQNFWSKSCQSRQRSATRNIIFFGNSHQLDAFNMFNTVYGNMSNVNLIYFQLTNGCSIKFRNGRPFSPTTVRSCRQRFDILANQSFYRLIDIFVLAYYPAFGMDHIGAQHWKVLQWFARANKQSKLVVVGDFLTFSEPCADVANRFGTFDACLRYASVPVLQPLKLDEDDWNQTYLFINKTKLFCPTDLMSCVTHVKQEPMSYDRHHLSRSAGELAGYRMAKMYKSELVKLGLN